MQATKPEARIHRQRWRSFSIRAMMVLTAMTAAGVWYCLPEALVYHENVSGWLKGRLGTPSGRWANDSDSIAYYDTNWDGKPDHRWERRRFLGGFEEAVSRDSNYDGFFDTESHTLQYNALIFVRIANRWQSHRTWTSDIHIPVPKVIP